MIDENGNLAAIIALALTVTVKALIYTAATVAAVVATATIVDKVNENVKEQERKDNQRNHTVYQLRNKDTKQIDYVGRTVNPNARKNNHEKTKPGHIFEVITSGLTKEEARGLEQILMIHYHTKTEFGGLNKINGISPKNVRLGEYMRAAQNIAIKCVGNSIENAALCWMEEFWR